MFLTKKTHLLIIQVYEARISDLKQQIADLRTLSIPKSNNLVPLNHLEADAVMSASHEAIEVSEEELKEIEEAQAEAARLFSGQY